MTGPNFYTIDFAREVVLQGKSTTFITIGRNDDALGSDDLCIIIMPNTRTFNSYLSGTQAVGPTGAIGAIGKPFEVSTSSNYAETNKLSFNNVQSGMNVKNVWEFQYNMPGLSGPVFVTPTEIDFLSPSKKRVYLDTDNYLNPINYPASTGPIHIGEWDDTGKDRWKLNGKLLKEYEQIAYNVPPSAQDVINLKNVFDGTVESFSGGVLKGTGYVARNPGGWARVVRDTNNPNASVTLRIDYDGVDHSHMKFNLIIFKKGSGGVSYSTPLNLPDGSFTSGYYVQPDFGAKSGVTGTVSSVLDYQEVHFFGYKEAEVRTSRTTYQNDVISDSKIYDDRASYSLLKTNPKISGNVKITLDSTGNLWLNSIDANNELADSAYKKYPVSPLSTYSRDLYKFFKNGQTPTSIVFDLFQVDNLYQNTKRNLYEQYDNFYNYGVEQLKSKYYDENFSFFAPLWLRKNVPDFFIIFRLDHPISVETYKDASNPAVFESFFKDSCIVKTFDMREKSQLGTYLRKITTDPRFKERPLDVSFDNDIATTWNGVSYANGTMTGKGEFLYDYWRQDRPIIELEEYITGGYQRHGIISTNLVNLEFLFDDEEATPYSINRYFGLYVTENQLANFEIDPAVLGKISGQTPLPKPGVDGQPYSTKPFIQTNADGIELPVHYYHNPTSLVNNTNVPTYQGEVVGKFPLPSFVDDPLRIFYVKDRDDVFKRVSKLSEVDYGNPGTSEYRRVSQLKLFDNTEDISKYAGVNQITSQFSASLLNKGNSQLRLHLSKQDNSLVFADDEVIELTVNQYNSDPRNHQYKLNVKTSSPTSVTFNVFKDQFAEVIGTFSMPNIGSSVTVGVNDGTKYTIGQQVYVTAIGSFTVSDVIINNILGDTIDILNTGEIDNIPAGPGPLFNQLISSSRPTYESTYNFTPFTNDLTIDPILTLELVQPLSYIGDESYDIEIKDTQVSFNQIGGTTSPPTFAKASSMYQQFRWKMIANQVGLPAGSAWAYPIEDPNGYDYVTTFSNEGTEYQVATALAAAINSFENRPCNATVIDDVIYLKALRSGLEGDNIQLTRNMINGKSNVFNLGFYERSNVNLEYDVNVINSTHPAPVTLVARSAIAGTSYTYVNIYKTPTGTEIHIRQNVDPTNYTTASTTGVPYSLVIAPTITEFSDPDLAFAIDLTNLPLNDNFQNIHCEFIIETLVSPLSVTQLFVGGSERNRNRARIGYVDSERYFSDRRVKLTANIITGSNVLSNVPLIDYSLYVGASITGTGIPENSYVKEIDYVSNLLYISNPATLGTPAIPAVGVAPYNGPGEHPVIPAIPYTTDITVGDLSILNNTSIKDQWYQTQKGLYSPMIGWKVQGRYVYSLPNLEEPIYDSRHNISDYRNLGEYSIIQIEDANQEFYQTTDKRIVAYNIYRPILGMFSIFPIKEFDFDFNFSDYSYTPILEAFRYYFNETINVGSSVILPSGENYRLTPVDSAGKPMRANLQLTIEGLNPDTKTWDYLETLTLNKDVTISPTLSTEPYIINTYYPFYVYDENEQPQVPGDPAVYFIGGSGKRNFMRRSISSIDVNNNVTEKIPLAFRLTYNNTGTTTANGIQIVKNDYVEDNDLKSFQGFAAITDIYSPEDADAVRGLLNDGNYVDAFLYQSLRSEYDRLRENFNKDYALRSRVVPYISKWVQEGTDARDNYYRLDNSKAFGITNFSPDTNVNFAEPSLLTNEFPYLDTVPKDYPAESLEGSRSYMFAKLGDIAKGNKTWLDLITTNDEDDWFTKYFAIGYPTEINQEGDRIPKSRDERYTFMIYNEGLKRSQTIFRGGKIQVLDVNDQLIPPTEILDSPKFDDYKFATIARILPYDPYFVEKINSKKTLTTPGNSKTQKPVDIEIYRNDKFKSITMIITVRVQDYRVQSGLSDYLFLYAVNDQLKNYNQAQTVFGDRTISTANQVFGRSTDLSITDFIPYAHTTPTYEDFSVLRPRQGFFGGGYLELGDTRLGGLVSENSLDSANIPKWVGGQLTLKYRSVDPTYNFSVLNEIIPTADDYFNNIKNAFSYPVLLNVNPTSRTKAGSIFKLINSAITSNSRIVHIDRSDSRLINDQYLPDQTIFGSQKLPMQSGVTPGLISSIGEFKIGLGGTTVYPGAICELETFNIKGGTQVYLNIKNLLTYASIKEFINSDSAFIEYYKVVGNKKIATSDFKLRMIEPDQIIKTGVLAYVNDEDKPIEYLSTATIGYNIVNTNQNEVVFRHRGTYEPRANDILSFWVREDENFTNHFGKDYLLFNTHFNDKSPQSGFLRNYGINKVSDAEVLKIKSGGAYKSVYPLIGEIAIDSKEIFTLSSTWDKNYYRKYYDTTSWNDMDGIEEMQEFKSFLGSKAMNIPKTQLLDTFNSTEATSSVLEPAEVVGVKLLSKKAIKRTDVEGNTKPILTIDLNIKERILRKLYEDISLSTSFDEFTWLTTLGIVNFDGLTSTDIERLKKEYLLKNILQLYTISEIKLYALSKEGIPLFDITIDDANKIAAGYRVDKDCKVVNVSEWNIRITKQLDTKKPFGYAVSATIKRI